MSASGTGADAAGATGISASTRLAVVLGYPVEHSQSPAMHNAAFAALETDAVFLALNVAPPDLGDMVRALGATGCVGASVTVPHKTAVIEHCDRLSATATTVGAVNCLEFTDVEVIGHNTDAVGYANALSESFGERDWSALILGGGGAARAVACGIKSLGGATTVMARRPSAVGWAKAVAFESNVLEKELAEANLIVDCTSAGLSERTDGNFPALIDLSRCRSETVISSLIYHRETFLIKEASKLGLATLDGAGMLIHQGLAALTIWLGTAPRAEILANALTVR